MRESNGSRGGMVRDVRVVRVRTNARGYLFLLHVFLFHDDAHDPPHLAIDREDHVGDAALGAGN